MTATQPPAPEPKPAIDLEALGDAGIYSTHMNIHSSTGELNSKTKEEPEHPENALDWSMIFDYMNSKKGFKKRHIQKLAMYQRRKYENCDISKVMAAMIGNCEDEFLIIPQEHLSHQGDRKRSNESVEWMAEQTAHLITPNEHSFCKFLLAEEFRRNPHIFEQVSNDDIEYFKIGRAVHPATELLLIAEFQMVNIKRGWTGSIKTTQANTWNEFKAEFKANGFEIEAMISLIVAQACGLPIETHKTFVQQTIFPFQTYHFELPSAVQFNCDQAIQLALRGIKKNDFTELIDIIYSDF